MLGGLREADHPFVQLGRVGPVAGEPGDVGVGVAGEHGADRNEGVLQRVSAAQDGVDEGAPGTAVAVDERWIVSNCACTIAARTTGFPEVAVVKRARLATRRGTSPSGGGTNAARSGDQPGPPTQFCSCRSPLSRRGSMNLGLLQGGVRCIEEAL